MSQIEEQVKKKVLYSFWRNIPLIKRISKDEFEVVNQETRGAIVEILRTGIKDEQSENSQRYALNAHEIQEYLNTKDLKSSLQNIYFHLNILIEGGIIKEVAILKEGRFNKRYYGRTAKLFLGMGYVDIESTKDKEKKFLLELIKVSNSNTEPENTVKVVDLTVEEKWNYVLDIEERIYQWFENNAEILIESNIDIKKTYDFLINFAIKGNATDSHKNLISLLKI